MNYNEARQITKTFKRNNLTIEPTLSSDWEYYFEGEKLYFKSESLNINNTLIKLITFTKDFLLGNNHNFNKNKLVGDYAFTSIGFVKGKTFLEAVEIESLSDITPIDKSEFLLGKIYENDKGNKYIYLDKLIGLSMFGLKTIVPYEFRDNKIKILSLNNMTDNIVNYTSYHKFISEINYKRNELFERLRFYMDIHSLIYLEIDNKDKLTEFKSKNMEDRIIKVNGEYYIKYNFFSFHNEKNRKEINLFSIKEGGTDSFIVLEYLKIINIKLFLKESLSELNYDFKDNKYIDQENKYILNTRDKDLYESVIFIK